MALNRTYLITGANRGTTPITPIYYFLIWKSRVRFSTDNWKCRNRPRSNSHPPPPLQHNSYSHNPLHLHFDH